MITKFSIKILLISLLLTSFFPLVNFPQKVYASSQFSTGYDISFVFDDSGMATVTHNITLTNLTKDYYATEYSLTTGSSKITNISGSDSLGSLAITTKTEADSTVLIAKLNKQVVGSGKSVNFKISYNIDSLAIKRGNIWDVNVPQIVTNENVSGYKLTLSVPKSYGNLGKMSPEADTTSSDQNNSIFVFSKNLSNSIGVGASFGNYQEFKFTLKYRYKNPNIAKAKATIALPPDTNYQALYYTALDPRPVSMHIDSSGNYLADYIVAPGKNLEVIANGYVQIVDSDTNFQTPVNYSASELSEFTKSDRYIESDNQQIQQKAKELAGPKEIYDYVESTLKYDFTRLTSDSLGRRGALAAFNNPENSICTDFTDLFVALARAKGIPARGLVGYGYTDNTSLRPTKIEGLVNTTLLHAWPEYFDKAKNHWIQVDPTWGSTTGGVDYFNRLDTNHFVFAINGTSSVYPLPAGAYKTSSDQTDDVLVDFSQDPLPKLQNPKITLASNNVIAGFSTNDPVKIENLSGRALFDSTLALDSKNSILGLISNKDFNFGTLLPFEVRNTNVNLRSESLVDNKSASLLLNFKAFNLNEKITFSSAESIKIAPFFSLGFEQIILLLVLLLVCISWVYPIYHHRQKISSQT